MTTFSHTTQISGSCLQRTLQPSADLMSAIAAVYDGEPSGDDAYGPTYAFAASVDGVQVGGVTLYTRCGWPRLGGWGRIGAAELDAFEAWLPQHLIGILMGP